MKRMVRIYIRALIFFPFPVRAFITVEVMMPNELPSAMLYVKGMERMSLYEGMAWVGSLKLMHVTAVNLR